MANNKIKPSLKITASFQSVMHDNKQSTLTRVFESEHSIANFMQKKMKQKFNLKNGNDMLAIKLNMNNRETKKFDEIFNHLNSHFKTFLMAELKINAKDFLIQSTVQINPQTIKFTIQYII